MLTHTWLYPSGLLFSLPIRIQAALLRGVAVGPFNRQNLACSVLYVRHRSKESMHVVSGGAHIKHWEGGVLKVFDTITFSPC